MKENENRKHPNEEFDIALSLEYKKKCSIRNKISFKDILVEDEAQITIGNAILAISDHFNISTDILTKSIAENIFDVNDELVIIFNIPELECENIITIPKSYWHYKKDIKNNDSNITYH